MSSNNPLDQYTGTDEDLGAIRAILEEVVSTDESPGGSGRVQARLGADAESGTFPIVGHDVVNNGPYEIPGSISDMTEPPDIGGAQNLVLGLESRDDQPFKAEIRFQDNRKNTLFTLDSDRDADLASGTTDPLVFYSTSTVLDFLSVRIVHDDANAPDAQQNRIQGGVSVK